jgi:TonB family protein
LSVVAILRELLQTEQEPPAEPSAEPSSERLSVVAILRELLQTEQEPPAEPSSERIAELVERAAALQEQLQAVLDELQTLIGDPDRVAGNSTEPIRIGGGVRAPAKIGDVAPVYPAEARTARVQGVVILEATVSSTGEVTDVEVLRSVPLLDEAAVAAVRQWRYEPTLVDGVAVPVLMTVTVNFALR